MGKFPECLTELSARHTIKAGDYSLTFLFCSLQITSMGTELSLYLTIKINLSICPISLPSFLLYLFVFPLTVNYLHYNTFISFLMYIMITKSSYKGKKNML